MHQWEILRQHSLRRASEPRSRRSRTSGGAQPHTGTEVLEHPRQAVGRHGGVERDEGGAALQHAKRACDKAWSTA